MLMLRYRASNRKNKNSALHSNRTCVSRCLSAFFPCQSAQKETGGAVSQARSGGKPSPSTDPVSCTANAVSVLMSVGIFSAFDVRTARLSLSSKCLFDYRSEERRVGKEC